MLFRGMQGLKLPPHTLSYKTGLVSTKKINKECLFAILAPLWIIIFEK